MGRTSRGLAAATILATTVVYGCKIPRPIMTTPGPSETLAQFADEYWQDRLRADPFEATFLGDRRYDDRVPDTTEDGFQKDIARLRDLRIRLDTAVAKLPVDAESDRVTAAALLGEIDNDLAARACRLHDWTVDPRDGVHMLIQNLARLQTVTTPEQGRALLSRWRQYGGVIDAHADRLKQARAQGQVAPRAAVLRVVRQLEDLFASDPLTWEMGQPARDEHPVWTDAQRTLIRHGVNEAVRDILKPALMRYLVTLKNDILPAARPDDRAGILNVPGGSACYRRLIQIHTSLDLDPDVIHTIGIDENAKIRAEILALGERLFGTNDFAAIKRRLREDRGLYFRDREQIEAKATELLNRAQASQVTWIGRLPRTPCVVKRVEAFEEKDTYIAYYRQPAIDGSRPGAYHVNTYQPETRPRFEAEVLAFHESIPGHHTQIALAQELQGIPEFRKHLGVTAFVEGWALYSERLADELGLYSGDMDRLGMLSFDAWRASRLVVDTGIHEKGWSRAQAVSYLRDNTLLADNNIDNEVDRYIGWPGQALAYKLGQRELFAIRHDAERRLGARFDLRSFHDILLSQGAVSLRVLREVVQRWIQQILATTPKAR